MKVDPLAQLVEHNTFNVGVLGSSPKRITKKEVSTTSFLLLEAQTQGFFQSFHFVKAFRRNDDEPQAIISLFE